MANDTYLYNWLFHYNPYMDRHFAFHREDFIAYMNGTETKHPVIKSNSYDTLVAILNHFKGNPSKLMDHEQNRKNDLPPM